MPPPKGFKTLMTELEGYQKFIPVNKQKEFGFLIKDLRERGKGISLCGKGQETLAITPDGEELFRFTDQGQIAINPKFSIYDLTKRFWRVVQDTNPFIGKIDELKRNNKLLNERIAGMDEVLLKMDKKLKSKDAKTEQVDEEPEVKSKKKLAEANGK